MFGHHSAQSFCVVCLQCIFFFIIHRCNYFGALIWICMRQLDEATLKSIKDKIDWGGGIRPDRANELLYHSYHRAYKTTSVLMCVGCYIGWEMWANLFQEINFGANVSINLSCSPDKGNLFVQGQRLDWYLKESFF